MNYTNFITKNDYKQWLITTGRTIRETRSTLKNAQRSNSASWKQFYELDELSKQYRTYHIAYSMLRGKSLETIEKISYTKPDMSSINEIINFFRKED